ncbi:glycosyltransferase family 2 protein [Candidatus Woesearchaeota archaeon]|nr:glycosyltransferase family 2 protein [Candidatus Woesearchaeota archaeon]MBW3021725.1 glycosyltransferase family 2 protein [Candidatus Woesearchaeota archaeon]
MKTAAIIPAYNEEKNIADVILKTKGCVDEIIVVDDGSRDSTFMMAKQAGANIVLRHMVNMGKGLAMNTGMEAAYKIGADVVVFIDADGQHDPGDISRLVNKLKDENYDLVTGVRRFNKNMPIIFRFGNQFLVAAFNFLFGTKMSDLSNGFRAINMNSHNDLKWNSCGYAVETEMLANAARKNLRIGELSIETKYLDRYKGTTVLDGIKIFLNMLMWRVR